MADRDRSRESGKPPGQTGEADHQKPSPGRAGGGKPPTKHGGPGAGLHRADDTGTEFRPPTAEFLESMEGPTPAEPGLPFEELTPVYSRTDEFDPSATDSSPTPGSSEGGSALERRWRLSPASRSTNLTGRTVVTLPHAREDDEERASPFVPEPEETTDAEIMINLGNFELDRASQRSANESDDEHFDRLLEAYARDFDDDRTRSALTELADRLDRWADVLATAKRLLARHSGTTGEDRLWDQLSNWSRRAHGGGDVPTIRSRLLDITTAGPALTELLARKSARPAADQEVPSTDLAPVTEPPRAFSSEALAELSARGAPMSWEPETELAPDFPEQFAADSAVELDPVSSEDDLLSAAQERALLQDLPRESRTAFVPMPPLSGLPAPKSIPIPASLTSVEVGAASLTAANVSMPMPSANTGTKVSPLAPAASPAATIASAPPSISPVSLPKPSAPPRPLSSPPPPVRRPVAAAEPEWLAPISSVNPPESAQSLDADDLEELEALESADQLANSADVLSESEEMTPRPVAPPPRDARSDAPKPLTLTRASIPPPVPQAPPPPPAPRAIDPAVLETGELDVALAGATNDLARARILVERAKREIHRGAREKAIDSYRDALAFDTTNGAALDALERLYRESKNVSRLNEILEQKVAAAKTDGDRMEALLAASDLYENELNDLPGAIARIEAAHALKPRDPKPLLRLAHCHEKAGSFQAAVADLESLLKAEISRAEKLDTLQQIAQLEETKLDDIEAAIGTYERMLAENPQHRGALEELARLGEKSGHWRANAKLIERQIDLAKEPKEQARLLVELGDLLAVADRDPDGARKHYERAAKVFPAHPAAWRGLEQLSTWSGDPARAEFYLEQRVRHTADLVERARVLVELAHYRAVTLNKQAESLAAYELAIKADPNNEVAANALVQPLLAARRWADVAQLCDVLYRSALRAKDDARAAEILETSWEVATALGSGAQMLAVAAARVRLAPKDEHLATLLLDTAYQWRSETASLKKARAALDLVHARARGRAAEDPSMLAKLGEVLRAMGEMEAAESAFERVLAQQPTDTRALAFLSQQAEARGDFRRAASLKERLAQELPAGDDRLQLLLSAGDLWLHAKGQVGSALRAYEAALREDPRNVELLRTLLGLYIEQANWQRVAPALRALADSESHEPARKAKTLIDLANVLEAHLDDAEGATQVLEEALALDRRRLDGFERLVRILTGRKDWIALANAYRQMLGRLDESAEPKLAFALHHQLGLVYRDRIGDAERALKAFTQAATLRPDDMGERKIVTELLVVTSRLDAAVDVARATLRKEPLEPELYRDLYELFLRAHAYDKAWCVAETMSVLGDLNETERQFVADYPPTLPSDIPASLLATAWPTHIHHAELDRTLSSALQIAVAVYLRARVQQVAAPVLGTALEHDPSAEAARVLAAFRNAGEVLACQMPMLHGSSLPGALFTNVLSVHPTLSVSLATSATIPNDLLNFLATKHLAELQPALRARSLFPSVQELKQLFFTTTQLATSGAGSMMRPGWDNGLGDVMTPEERAALRGLVAGVASSGQKLDVKRWLQLAEVTAMRAGLLICGSLSIVQRAMMLEPRAPDDLPIEHWLAELGMYAVSEHYFELRETIHVAI